MGELYKSQHTIDEMLNRMGVSIVLDGDSLSEKDREEAEKNGDIVNISKEKKEKDGKEET